MKTGAGFLRPNRSLQKVLKGAGVLFCPLQGVRGSVKGRIVWACGLLALSLTCVRMNVSGSLPETWWWGVRCFSLPERGSVVLVERKGWAGSLLKQVTGVAGDRVQVEGDVLRINGTAVVRLKAPAPGWKPLPDQVIPQGYVFVSTPHSTGLDSRWARIGLFAVHELKARMWPVPFLTRRHP